MKKHYSLLLIIILVTLIMALSGCIFDLFSKTPKTVDNPVVTLSNDGSYIYWQEVNNAVQYKVVTNASGNKTTYIVRSIEDYSFIDIDEVEEGEVRYYFEEVINGMTVEVIAIADGIVFESSEYVAVTGEFVVLSDELDAADTTDKSFDRANPLDITYNIITYTSTSYSITSPTPIVAEDYTYEDYTLTFLSSYLMGMTLGDNVLHFITDSADIVLTITISDSRVPYLISTELTNYSLNDPAEAGVEILYYLSDFEVSSVIIGTTTLLETINYIIDYNSTSEQGVITLLHLSLENAGIGEHIVTIATVRDTETVNITYTINIIDTAVSYSIQSSINYDTYLDNSVAFDIRLEGYSLDTILGNLLNTNWSYSDTTRKLTFNPAYLETLEIGNNQYAIITNKLGYDDCVIPININVISTNTAIENLRIDLDIDYPNTIVMWDYYGSASTYDVKIGSSGTVTQVSNKYASISSGKYSSFEVFVRPTGATSWVSLSWTALSASLTDYLNSSYEYMGETHDLYIASQEEFNNYIDYGTFDFTGETDGDDVGSYPDKEMDEIYIAFDYDGDITDELSIAMDNVSLPSSWSIRYSFIEPKYNFTIDFRKPASPNIASTYVGIEEGISPSHIDELKGTAVRNSSYDSFAINSLTKTQEVYTSEQLFAVANLGLKPIPVASSDAETIYNLAKNVLRDNITNDMTDIDKLHAIYDYLTENVMYAQDILDIYASYPSNPLLSFYNAFYMEGVFVDGLAVCDGISKAFTLLARMEGIETVQISGTSRRVGHAWNKVKLGNDWYVVDATWGNMTTETTSEYTKHEYFLVNDIYIQGSHDESNNEEARIKTLALGEFEFYKSITYVSEGITGLGNTYDYYIESQDEFTDMVRELMGDQNAESIEFYNASGLDTTTLYNGLPPTSKQLLGSRYSGDVVLWLKNT